MFDLDITVNVITLNLSAEDAASTGLLEALNSAAGVLANYLQIISFVQGLLSDADEILSNIAETTQDILQDVQGFSAELPVLLIAPVINSAINRLNTLWIEGPGGMDVNEPMFFAAAQDAAYLFAPELGGTYGAYWTRPYSPNFVFNFDSWGYPWGKPALLQSDEDTTVFDPNLPLPAFCTAITMFIGVATIFHRNDPQTVQPYFTDLATFLEQDYQTMVEGLQQVPIPDLESLQLMDADLLLYFPPIPDGVSLPVAGLSFDIWHGEIGVVDCYAIFSTSGEIGSTVGYPSPVAWGVPPQHNTGGLYFNSTRSLGSVTDVYPTLNDLIRAQLRSNLAGSQVNVYRWFHIRMRLGNLARFKALYLAKRYDQVWSMLQKLRVLSAGLAGTPAYGLPPAPGPELTDYNADWSLSGISSIIHEQDIELDGGYFWDQPFTRYPVAPGQYAEPIVYYPVTVENVIAELLSVIDNSANYPDEPPADPTPVPARPVSLRQTIAAAAF